MNRERLYQLVPLLYVVAFILLVLWILKDGVDNHRDTEIKESQATYRHRHTSAKH